MAQKTKVIPQHLFGMRGERVIVAMSGGVDSSVAAALLKEQGYEVVGIFMKLWAEQTPDTDLVRENVCCSADAATAARAVANKLDIPFYVVNFADEFKKMVVDDYIKEYELGRTPNPCVICNRDIKGELLMRKVEELEVDYLATGHYARIKSQITNHKLQSNSKSQHSKNKAEEYYLYQARDLNKDQTYFLWTLTQKQLAKMLFPIGDLSKPQVRAIARKLGLPTAERKESQGICFIPDRDTCGFLRRHAKKLNEPGDVVDLEGNKLGLHAGLINYTIGQRERLGIGGPRAYYVLKLDRTTNQLVVGDEGDLYRTSFVATSLNWLNPEIDLTRINHHLGAKIRYGHPIEPCNISVVGPPAGEAGDRLSVEFDRPQRAITPGQSVVIYQKKPSGYQVLGGGVIEN